MTKQIIEVEVPEGWRVKEYRMPNKGDYFWHQNRVCVASSSFIDQRLIIEKIKPRRIVLEETEEIDKDIEAVQHFNFGNTIININSPKIWREVKETDEDPYLKLTKKHMLELIEHIKLGGQLNHKIAEFIKENS